ncbi:hypothetical protein [Trichormus variabilis]|nr:hypothetical protein [Trichormus variabilis]
MKAKVTPNQGISNSVINAGVTGIIHGLSLSFFLGLMSGLIGWLSLLSLKISFPQEAVSAEAWFSTTLNITLFASITGLVFGLVSGLISGRVCIEHFTLRLILYCNGYIPWNYARFLDYCTERMLLQRVGGRYRFIHKLLQDHFAQMEFRQD